MKEPNDEDLLLYFYDEAPEAEEIRQALDASPELRARYEELCQALELASRGLEAPARPEGYGAEVWAKLAPHLEAEALVPSTVFPSTPLPSAPLRASRERVGGLRRMRWVGLAAAAVLLLVVGFYAGRLWPRLFPGSKGSPDLVAAAASAHPLPLEARERILARAVADHLERSERLFTELANTRAEGSIDVAAERRWAHDLLAANRLYRQSTQQGGRPRLASLLDEIEPFLIELSHGPDEIPAADLADFRHRFEERALLFKMRVVGARLSAPQSP